MATVTSSCPGCGIAMTSFSYSQGYDDKIQSTLRIGECTCMELNVTHCGYKTTIGSCWIYTVSQKKFPLRVRPLLQHVNLHRVRKKGTNSILGITSSNTDRFSNFFQCHNLLEICNKTIIKFPTTPQTRRYTTL